HLNPVMATDIKSLVQDFFTIGDGISLAKQAKDILMMGEETVAVSMATALSIQQFRNPRLVHKVLYRVLLYCGKLARDEKKAKAEENARGQQTAAPTTAGSQQQQPSLLLIQNFRESLRGNGLVYFFRWVALAERDPEIRNALQEKVNADGFERVYLPFWRPREARAVNQEFARHYVDIMDYYAGAGSDEKPRSIPAQLQSPENRQDMVEFFRSEYDRDRVEFDYKMACYHNYEVVLRQAGG
ncbi:MAG: hypothetical protein HQL59_13370, partial [Magnetococcales bacterium]|nr:hypothetical protein [Magnetococcales bacterium]